jgi:hypothetical protein
MDRTSFHTYTVNKRVDSVGSVNPDPDLERQMVLLNGLRRNTHIKMLWYW